MKHSLILVLLAIVFNFHSVAAENTIPLTIKEIPTNGSSDPTKPKSPSRVHISACIDDNAVIVSSSVSVLAQITITNDLTGECLFDRVVALAPNYHCFIPNVSGVLTLTVSVGDKTYEGQFVH